MTDGFLALLTAACLGRVSIRVLSRDLADQAGLLYWRCGLATATDAGGLKLAMMQR